MSTHRIICTNDDCYYNKHCRDCIYKGDIIIGDDDATCQNFLGYWNTPKYQHEFYVAKGSVTGKDYREKMFFGAVTEYEGFTLYYRDRELSSETWVTEERTGVGAYYRDFTNPERLKEIKKRITQYPNVSDLPDMKEILDENKKQT